jgi:hypothetical protein
VVRHKFALRISPRLLLSDIISNLIQSSHSGLRKNNLEKILFLSLLYVFV